MNEAFLMGILATASGGIATLLNVGLAVVGLVYVRRVHAMAGFALAGAGAIGAFASILQRLAGFAMSFGGGMTVYTVVQIFNTLVSMVAGALIPVAIFLLAGAIKQGARPHS